MAANQTPPANTNLTGGAAGGAPEYPSAFSLFKPSWEGLKQNLTELIVIWIVPTIAFAVLALISESAFNNSNDGTGALFAALAAVVGIFYVAFIGPAVVHIQLKSSLMEKATYDSAWETSKKYWWRFILLAIMVGVTVLVGFILFIVPGIIFLKRYFLSHYALIDQDLGLTESMHKSNELSRNRSMSIYGVIGVDILINIPQIIPVLGYIVTFVLQIAYFCAPAIRYQQLKGVKPAPAAASARPATATRS